MTFSLAFLSWLLKLPNILVEEDGGGGGQREKEAEVYRRWETRILKVAESGINKEKSHNILQYLAIKQVQRTGSQQLKISGGGDERYRKWEAQTPCPPPSPPQGLGAKLF